jgi:hypothetical protein
LTIYKDYFNICATVIPLFLKIITMAEKGLVIEESDNVKASQLKEFYRQIDEKAISGEMLQYFLENTDLQKAFKLLAEQDKLIKKMRDVLRLCSRDGVGTFYQQQAAREMLATGRKTFGLPGCRFNLDGTYSDSYKEWIFSCNGQEGLDRNAKEEKELLSL